MRRIGKLFKYLVLIILLIMLMINVAMIVQRINGQNDMPMVLGYGRAVVVTGSMEPVIAPGDMVVIRRENSYEVGDIVMYQANSYITHRIIDITADGFITQGDANNVNDGEIKAEQIVGKVVMTVPKAGYVAEFLSSPLGILVLILVFIIIVEVPRLIQNKTRKR